MNSVFISYSHNDRNFAERLARDLEDAGIYTWVDFRSIQGGQLWEHEIFRGINTTNILVVCLTPQAIQSNWVRREILVARSQQKQIIPIMVTQCFEFLINYEETRPLLDVQIILFENQYEVALKDLLTAITRNALTKSQSMLDWKAIKNPYKGLEAFQQTDADYYFGRQHDIQKVLHRLQGAKNQRFIAIVGASGSGKSSLVRAGIIPALRKDSIEGSSRWPVVVFNPGGYPTESMAVRLLPLIGGGRMLPEVIHVLEQSSTTLHQVIEGILGQEESARFVMIIDQFEEVFTRASNESRKPFLDLISTGVTRDDGRLVVIVTMRSDFYAYLTPYHEITSLFEQGNILLNDLTYKELHSAIEGPAHQIGLTFEEGLTDRILEDINKQPGTLPLLQYTLSALFNLRDKTMLTRHAYEKIGGARQALATHAEEIYESFDPVQRDVLRRLCVQLVELVEGGQAARRRVDRSSLTFIGVSDDKIAEVISRLTAPDVRLLIASREITAQNQTSTEPRNWLEICHEALITHWSRLKNWIKDSEELLKFSTQLNQNAQDWIESGHNPDYLLLGSRLERAETWLNSADANTLQLEYIKASVEARKQVQEEQEREASLYAQRINTLNLILRNIYEGVVLIQNDNTVTICNPQFSMLTGINDGDILLKPKSALINALADLAINDGAQIKETLDRTTKLPIDTTANRITRIPITSARQILYLDLIPLTLSGGSPERVVYRESEPALLMIITSSTWGDIGANLSQPTITPPTIHEVVVTRRITSNLDLSEGKAPMKFGDLLIDTSTRQVHLKGKRINLTPVEYKLLHELALNAGRVLTHQELLLKVWGEDYRSETHYLWVTISRLRKKLEQSPDAPHLLLTEPGVGYYIAE